MKWVALVPLQDEAAIFLHTFSKADGFHWVFRICRCELEEHLVLEAHIGEGHLVGSGAVGEEFDDVFLKAEFEAEDGENNRRGYHQNIHQGLVSLEEMV